MNQIEYQQKNSLNLQDKIILSQQRVKEFYNKMDGNVYIGFSGGKDSTVLLNIVRDLYKDIPAVFCDTGLEYPEIRSFVKTIHNVVWVKPKLNFKDTIERYGYPVISKEVAKKIHEIRTTKSEFLYNKRLNGDIKGNGKLSNKWKFLIEAPFKISGTCCDIFKKRPMKLYEKISNNRPFLGLLAKDSSLRMVSYLQTGCNSYTIGHERSSPLGFWNDSDIWEYINTFNIPYSDIYKMGYQRTGCMFCMFGIHLDNSPNRFELMSTTHPNQYEYCMNILKCRDILEFLKIPF